MLFQTDVIQPLTDSLRDCFQKAILRYPKFFDERLLKGIDRLVANSSDDFLATRTFSFSRLVLLAQFFLQKKIEEALLEEVDQNHLFIKLFRHSGRLSAAIAFSSPFGFQKDQFIKAINTLLPGVHEIPKSFYLWHHPELPYFYWYTELHKLRGGEPTNKELDKIERILREQLLATPPLTPALFWPYNKEESFRQIQLLKREMKSVRDLPHISILFQEQHTSSLEFFIHLVRPKSSISLDQSLKQLPDSLRALRYFHSESSYPFPIEIEGFSINVPSNVFDIQDSINLLYARRYVLKLLESAIGPLRDYNGGLFATQQQHFEAIRVHLGAKIPHFDLFAERLFYALHPVETWLSLSLDEAEELFKAFSELLQEQKNFAIRSQSNKFTIIKTTDGLGQQGYRLNNIELESPSYAQIIIGGFHYLCLLGPATIQLQKLMQNSQPIAKRKILRLAFQEGALPSLNPHYSSSDMRCRLLDKLLFEGLTRLNEEGKPEMAGAIQHTVSKEGTVYTFQLRPSFWSNGENVTSIDYAASWQSALRDRLSHPELFFCIKNARAFYEKNCPPKDLGIQTIDTQSIQIELEKPDPDFLKKLAEPSFFPLFGMMREPKWFNGPYLLREQTKDGLLLERNPYFWDVKRTFFEQIDIRYFSDIETIYRQFQEGKVDWIGDPLSTLPTEQIKELQLSKKAVKRRFFLYFNTWHPLLSSPLIRRALCLSIDRAKICSEIFKGCEPILDEAPDEKRAKALFQQGLDALGIENPSLTLTYSHQTKREELAKYLQSAWEKTLQIPIKLEELPWNDFRSRLEKRDFAISGTIQDTVNEDSSEFFERFEHESSWNFSNWSCPRYRAILKNEKNWREQALAILREEAPCYPLFNYVHSYAHHPQLDRIRLNAEGCIDFSWARFKL